MASHHLLEKVRKRKYHEAEYYIYNIIRGTGHRGLSSVNNINHRVKILISPPSYLSPPEGRNKEIMSVIG